MAVIETDMPQNDEEFNSEIHVLKICHQRESETSNVDFVINRSSHRLFISDDLKRHITKKHRSTKAQETSSSDCFVSDLVPTTKIKLFKKLIRMFLSCYVRASEQIYSRVA